MYPEPLWLLDCEPRPAQLEALRRSYYGYKSMDHKDDIPSPQPLKHCGRPTNGWGHFTEMRVGKTPTGLNEAGLFKGEYGLTKLLILSPNRYKYAWGLEIDKFGFDSPHHVLESSKRKAASENIRKYKELALIVNYEALIYPDTMDILMDWVDNKAVIIADESVMIKNPNSTMFEHSLKLGQQAAVTRPMTGLPAPQGPHDLWAQLRFAKRLNGFMYYPFRGKFCERGGYQGKKIIGIRNEDELNVLLDECCFRGRRKDWGTKIECDYGAVNISMTDEQRKCYDEMEEDFIAWIDDSTSVSAEQVITKRMKMQQISSGWIYDENRNALPILPFNKTPKFMDLITRLETEISGKTFIVAHYTHTIEMLKQYLSKYNPAIVAGGQHMKRWGLNDESEKARFNNDPKCRVIIGQSQAIKYGATLMGVPDDPCLTLCYFENNYSLDNRSQTEERPQGEGQVAALYVLDYYTSQIEMEIVQALQRKKEISEVIMNHYKGQ